MNIQSITPKFYANFNNNKLNNTNQKNNSYPSLSPLKADTVSFGVGEKILPEGAKSVPFDLVKRVVQEAQADAQELTFILKKYLSKYVATSKNPEAPIIEGKRGIHVRVKTENSLRDKLTAREITTMYGAKNVGDVIGGRIVLRNSSPKEVDKILKAISDAHKQGALNIYEIEKWIPKAGKIYADTRDLGYGSSKGLAELEKATGLKSSVAPQDSGYPAIHIGIKTKNGFKAEIQIMGVDVEDLKEIEDLGYKIRCGKPIPTLYNPMRSSLYPAFKVLEENKLEDHYMDYVNDSYLFALNYPIQKYNSRKKAPFLQIPYFLPKELDFTNMAEEMEKCRRSASEILKEVTGKNVKDKK